MKANVATGLLLLSIVFSVLCLDWSAVLVLAFGVVLVYEYNKHNLKLDSLLSLILSVSAVLLIILDVIALTGALSEYKYDSVSCVWAAQMLALSPIVFFTGMMFAMFLNGTTNTVLSHRWVIVFSIVFTMAFAALACFMTGYYIWDSGMPFSNEDCENFGRHSNPILMAPACCFFVSCIVFSTISKKLKLVRRFDIPEEEAKR